MNGILDQKALAAALDAELTQGEEGISAKPPAPTPPDVAVSATAGSKGTAFPFDAALPPAAPMRAYLPAAPFTETAALWQAQISAEALHDFKVSVADLGMRPADGALTRGQGGLAYTPHGFGQLLSLVLDEKPRNLSEVLRWIHPERRAPVYVKDVKGRSSRKADDLMVLRTMLTPGPGRTGLVRAVRATLSLRHSGASLDDKALCGALAAELAPDAPTAVTRGIDKTEGYAEVETVGRHLVRTLHWTNSETGSASLSFSAGARLRIVDALVVMGAKDEVVGVTMVEAMIANDRSRQRMRHTAPGGKQDSERQAAIATERMRTKIRSVLTKGEAISAAWLVALEDFAKGFEPSVLNSMEAAVAWEILVDAVEERTGFEGKDKVEFLATLNDEKRLDGGADLPRGSAAHIAAVFAVMGKRATTMDDAKRLQTIAGHWLMNGWRK